ELFDVRPWLLRVDEIRRQRRDTSPVVYPGSYQKWIAIIRQIGRRLHVHLAKHQSRDRDRSSVIHLTGFGMITHRDLRLRAKILYDYFLNVAVTLVEFFDREQRIDSLSERLADADENSR